MRPQLVAAPDANRRAAGFRELYVLVAGPPVRIRCLAAILITIVGGACALPGRWRRQDIPMPWCAPHTQATFLARGTIEVIGWPFDNGPSSIGVWAWADQRGRKTAPWRFADEIGDYLTRQKMLGAPKRLDFRFFIVSIKPTVVVMSPVRTNEEWRQIYQEHLRAFYLPEAERTNLANAIEYGPDVPYSDDLLIFMPSKDEPPQRLHWIGAVTEMTITRRESLQFERNGSSVRTQRTLRDANSR